MLLLLLPLRPLLLLPLLYQLLAASIPAAQTLLVSLAKPGLA
jgi:hypothetical protein